VDEIRRVAADEDAVLVAAAWSPDNSAAVTELLRTTRTPVLLIPEPASARRPDHRALVSSAGPAG
jgi:hypothetical protein